ncbi:MAG: tRNA pseudouridine(13) synthase TruD [Planctomycetaceae bacterium]
MPFADVINTILHPPRFHQPVIKDAVLKAECEDFQVIERPAYQPSGEGEHLYLWVEKRNVSADELVSKLARHLKVSQRDLGVAGLKDRRAVTRQFVSVPRQCEDRVSDFADERIRILSATPHGNKLRTGHLLGNEFRIVLRSTSGNPMTQEDCDCVSRRLQKLASDGVPNCFGSQRFGHEGRTAREGIDFLSGAITVKHWKPQQRRFMTRMVASAAQSAVFNLCLAQRVLEQSFQHPLPGDVVCRRDGARPFLFDQRGDTPADVLVPMGPMPGDRMLPATGDVLNLEQQAMASVGLSPEDFQRYPKLTQGTRRKYVEFPEDSRCELTTDGALVLTFALSAGTFATVVLAEIAELAPDVRLES